METSKHPARTPTTRWTSRPSRLSRPFRAGAALTALACLAPLGSRAEEKPLWELGLGAGVLSLPDYRGSDEHRAYVLPVPYVIYRGEWLKADREGARAELLGAGRVRLDMTAGASVPVSSSKNKARAGMPSLGAAIEVGPAVDVGLYRSDDERLRLKLRLPLTYGFNFGYNAGTNGWQFSPRVNLDIRDPAGLQGWNLGLLTGPVFGSRRRHAYFYDVAPQYATVERPAYRADGGYGGMEFVGALSKRFDTYWVGAFLRYDNLNGAAFKDSPLVKSRSYVAGGVGIAWMLGQSSRMVQVD